MNVPGFAAVFGGGSSPFVPGFYTDSNLVYDTQVEVLFLFSGETASPVEIVAEQFVPGTVTQYVNQTVGNSTTVREIQVPARLTPQWSNVTTVLYPRTASYVTLPIPQATSQESLEISVDGATWELYHLTPTSSSLAGIYTAGGIEGVAFSEAGVTAIIMVASIMLAQRFARRVYRTPRVPFWWPAAWIGIPIVAILGAYVPTNQFLGALSPWLYPVFFAAAAWPYLPRIFSKSTVAEFQSFEPRTSTQGTAPKVLLPVVTTSEGLRCAPETWREVFYTFAGVPLPEVRMETVKAGGIDLKISPSGLPVTCPMPPWYASDSEVTYWYESRRGLQRVRHRFRWTVDVAVQRDVVGPDGIVRSESKTKRRLSPHVEQGRLTGVFPPIRSIAEYVVGIRTIEQSSMDWEVDQLLNAELRGSVSRLEREARRQGSDHTLRAVVDPSLPAARDELLRSVEAGRRQRGGKREARDEGTTEGKETRDRPAPT
ncbi:MAG: hypothetical protein ACYDFT_00270 [Thermoplasmata archaeon]